MMTVSAMAPRGENYYTELAREDYYVNGGEPPGRWCGEGSQELGLPERVTKRDLRRLFNGLSTRGNPLVQNAGSKRRQPGWDITFSAPKSVSVLWSQVPELRQVVEQCQRDAVDFAMQYVQRTAGFTRRGKGGTAVEPAKLVVAEFRHSTSRDLDPQLHHHMLVLNVGVRADGTTGTILSKPLYLSQLAAGALYRAELAYLLAHRVGVTCDQDRFSFKVRDIPERLVTFFSKRRQAIENELKRQGRAGAGAAEMAALDTRHPKGGVPARQELFGAWVEHGRMLGFTPTRFQSLRAGPNCQSERAVRATLRDAVHMLTEEGAHFTEAQLLYRTALAAQGRGVGAASVIEAVSRAVTWAERVTPAIAHTPVLTSPSLRGALGQPPILKVVTHDGVTYYTTPLVWHSELKVRAIATQLRRATSKHGTTQLASAAAIAYLSRSRSLLEMKLTHDVVQLWKAFRRQKTAHARIQILRRRGKHPLSAEQAEAVRYLTSRKHGAIRMLEGAAGTGKTSTLGAVALAYRLNGYDVVGVSLAGKAKKELAEGANVRAYTFRGFMAALNPSAVFRLVHAGRQFGRALRKRRTYKVPRLKLGKRTLVILDEAGMLSTPDALSLMRQVRKSGATLICVGDRKQLQAIGRGGWFSYLCDRLGRATLSTNVRQKQEADKRLAQHAAEGRGANVVANLLERQRLVVGVDREAAINELVTHWRDRHRRERDKVLIFVATNQEASYLNARCQAERRSAGELRRRRFTKIWTETKHGERAGYTLYERDRVLFTKRSTRWGVENGDTGTLLRILRIPGLGTHLFVKLDNGTKVRIRLRRLRFIGRGYHMKDVRLGYAMTTHKGQGTTTDYAYVLTGGGMQHKEMSYVQFTRAREAVYAYTDRHEAGLYNRNLAKQLEQSREKKTALRVESDPTSLHQHDVTHRQRL